MDFTYDAEQLALQDVARQAPEREIDPTWCDSWPMIPASTRRS